MPVKFCEFTPGFLYTGDEASPGNNGLKDQALALKFVYENIERFGGDRNRITLIGHSAGGSSTHFHMMSNQSQGYFQAAMSLSGTGMNYWALSSHDRAIGLTNRIAKRMNCPRVASTDDVSHLNSLATINCLRKRNPVLLVSNQMNLLVSQSYCS
jgi:carboxylesterase type B